MNKLLVLFVLILVSISFAYHEFSVPKKAYKKVTIEWFGNEDSKTQPDSTVYLYYDKDGVEIYREVKKGCGNVIGSINADSVYALCTTWGTITEDAIDASPLTEDDVDITAFDSLVVWGY